MFASLRLFVFLLLVSVVCSQTGCVTLSALMGQKQSPQLDTSLLEAQGYSIPKGGMPTQVSQASGSGPHVVLEIRGAERHLESVPLPMDRALTIEDIVQQSQLNERLGRLTISIMRPNGQGAPPIRLDLKTDDNGKANNIGTNYGLLPGDHIIITDDQRSSLEKFVDKHLRNGL